MYQKHVNPLKNKIQSSWTWVFWRVSICSFGTYWIHANHSPETVIWTVFAVCSLSHYHLGLPNRYEWAEPNGLRKERQRSVLNLAHQLNFPRTRKDHVNIVSVMACQNRRGRTMVSPESMGPPFWSAGVWSGEWGEQVRSDILRLFPGAHSRSLKWGESWVIEKDDQIN